MKKLFLVFSFVFCFAVSAMAVGYSIDPISEPVTMILLGMGLISMATLTRKKIKVRA